MIKLTTDNEGNCRVWDDSPCLACRPKPHEALASAHTYLKACEQRIFDLMGYSESLLAKEVQGGKGEE